MIAENKVITLKQVKHVGEYTLELVFNDETQQSMGSDSIDI